MRIAVIGTGYVGLVTGTCLSEMGNYVTCVDIDELKIKKLKEGKVTICESGLEKLLLRNLKEGRLRFTTDITSILGDVELIFLALPTPPAANGDADIQYVLSVAEKIGKQINSYKVVVIKSTVPVGTSDKLCKIIANNYQGEFDVVSNPEFLREGVAVDDFMKPDRIVIGLKSERAKKIMEDLYAPFVRQGNPIFFMDYRSSELTKYASNSFLATKISFMNEIAQLCERMGADVDMVRRGVGSDERIGRRFLFPGIGYGGSCFPKDVKALISSADSINYDFKILKAVQQVNDSQKIYLVEKIKSYYRWDLKGKRFALWGLAFKPNTDDIREAPALAIIDILLSQGANVSAYDPEAMPAVKQKLGSNISYGQNQYQVLEGADALIIATEWSEFRTPDFEKIGELLPEKIIFDGRNLFNVNRMRLMGYSYISVGRQ